MVCKMACKLLPQETAPFTEKYDLERVLGKGSFGEVWVCKEKSTRDEYACKVFDKASLKSDVDRADVGKEAKLLQHIGGKHEAVVSIREALETDAAVHIVMDMCRGGDLFEMLKGMGRLPEPAAKHVFRQLASAVKFCHSLGVVHRDIKPENILFDVPAEALYHMQSLNDKPPPVQVKLADFGLAVQLDLGATTIGYTGSRFYTAPEMIEGRRYGRRVDVWSLGVVLCTMLTGRLPFAGKTKEDFDGLRRAILRGRVNFNGTGWAGVSDGAKDLVSKMLQVEPHNRIKSCDILSHPWLAECAAAAPAAECSPASMIRATQSAPSASDRSASQEEKEMRASPGLNEPNQSLSVPSRHLHAIGASPAPQQQNQGQEQAAPVRGSMASAQTRACRTSPALKGITFWSALAKKIHPLIH